MITTDRDPYSVVDPTERVRLPERAPLELLDQIRWHQALEAVCSENVGRALEAIQPLSQTSPFRNWKLFVKGMVAFHRNDSGKAARFFSEIAPDTVPGRARQPYLHWLGVKGTAGNGK